MKRGAILINQARGDLVDIEARCAALESGHLIGAAIDVFPKEPASKEEAFVTPLQNFENIILTPHVGGSTLEAQEAIGDDVAAKLARFLSHGATKGSVNVPELEAGPIQPGRVRLLSFHGNAPGYLSRLNDAVSAAGANIAAQHPETRGEIGYVIAALQGDLPEAFLGVVPPIRGPIRAGTITRGAPSTNPVTRVAVQ